MGKLTKKVANPWRRRMSKTVWHYCDLCSYKSNITGNLKRHKQYKHNIDIVWHRCDLCSYKCKERGNLKKHKQLKHNIDVVWHRCDLCSYKCKLKGHLKQHKADAHNIDVVWDRCDLCSFKCKQKGKLKRHKRDKHNIDVVWHRCDLCSYKCKQKSNLKTHKVRMHDIGNKECVVCYKRCGVLRQYKKHGICRECAVAYGARKERIELKYVKALKEHFDMPFAHDVRVGGAACQNYRPDVLFLDVHHKVHIQFELDEHQHGWKSGSYDCDEKRISDLYDEFEIKPEHYVVVRLNPDGYNNISHDRNKVFQERFNHLLEVLETVRNHPPKPLVSIIYMYYDESNHRIAKNIPKYMLNDVVKNIQ